LEGSSELPISIMLAKPILIRLIRITPASFILISCLLHKTDFSNKYYIKIPGI
jgi:hypothetical protein